MNTFKSNRHTHCLSRCRSVILGAATAAVTLLGVSAARPARAANILLSSGNSTVTIDPTSTAGVEDWTINGQNQLNQQWFWIRTGNENGQSSLNSLGTPSVTPISSSMTELIYGSTTGLQITVTYALDGGQSSSKTSDLNDSVMIDNYSGKSEKVEFFEYANFNLDDLTTGQTAMISGSNTATVTGNGYQSQTVVSPTPSDYEANTYLNLLDNISSGSTSYTLSKVSTAPAGDPEWGFEWILTLPKNGSDVITGDSLIQGTAFVVPEPVSSSISLLGLGGLFLSRPRRRDEVDDLNDD